MSEKLIDAEVSQGATGGALLEKDRKPEQETMVFELNPKTKDFGDVSVDQLDPLLKSETDSLSENSAGVDVCNSTSTRSKSSKRQRKNRRRRQKNAAAHAHNDSQHDSSVEFPAITEDSKEDGLGTDVDTGSEEASFVEVVVSAEPSVTLTTIEEAPSTDFGVTSGTEVESGKDSKRCVDTLLKIAKQKIMTGILKSAGEASEERDFEFNPNAREFKLGDVEERDLNMTVPPCSPSSTHNFSNVNKLESLEKQNITPRSVRFDESLPNVRSLDTAAKSVLEVEALSSAIHELHKARDGLSTSSNETVILVSAAPAESATSLLKGGSSSEDNVDCATYHFPSRESFSDSSEGIITHSHSSINIGTYRETIEEFKVQNPEEAKYLGEEVDTILSRSMDKFSSLMERSAGSEVATCRLSEPVSREEIPDNPASTSSLNIGLEPQEDIISISAGSSAQGTIEAFSLDITNPSVSSTQINVISSTSIEETGEKFPECNKNENREYFVLEPALEAEQDDTPSFQSENIVETLSELSVHSSCPEIATDCIIEYSADSPSTSPSQSQLPTKVSCVDLPECDFKYIPESMLINVASSTLCHGTQVHDDDGVEDELSLVRHIENYTPFINEEESALMEKESMSAMLPEQKSVEIFSLELPQNVTERSDAILSLTSLNNNAITNAESDVDSEPPPQDENLKRSGDFFDTETESDFPWLPERKASLAKILEEKRQREGTISSIGTGSTGKVGSLQDDHESPGCSCAKMCVIS